MLREIRVSVHHHILLQYKLEEAKEIDDYELLGKRTPNVKHEGEDYGEYQGSEFLERIDKAAMNRHENSLINLHGLYNIIEVENCDRDEEFHDFDGYDKNKQVLSGDTSYLHFFQGKKLVRILICEARTISRSFGCLRIAIPTPPPRKTFLTLE